MQSGDRKEDTFQTSVPFPFMGTPNLQARHTYALTRPAGIPAAPCLAALGSAALCAGWGNCADREAHCLYPLELYCWGLLPGRSPKTLSCCPASSGFPRWRRCGCADKQLHPEEWITSLVLPIRTRRLREAEGLCAER